jgi:DNA polymerase-4
MSLAQARRLCPQAVLLPGEYSIYRCFAEHVWQVCRRYTHALETYLDEACGDATGVPFYRRGDPLALGRQLQAEVLGEVGLPVSVGLAPNRMLAKIASSSVKPRGVAWIRPEEVDNFLAPLPIERLLGAGPKTAERLRDMNIRTVGGLRVMSRQALRSMFGQRGEVLYERCRGRDVQVVNRRPRPPSSISRETTFHLPTCDRQEIRGMLFYLLERAMRAVRQVRLRAGCAELTIRYDDWKELAGSRALAEPTADDDEVFGVVGDLLERLYRRRVALRHVGIVLSQLVPAGAGELFEPRQRTRRRSLYAVVDAIRHRWGHAAVVMGKSIELLGRLERNDYGFVLRTPALTK